MQYGSCRKIESARLLFPLPISSAPPRPPPPPPARALGTKICTEQQTETDNRPQTQEKSENGTHHVPGTR